MNPRPVSDGVTLLRVRTRRTYRGEGDSELAVVVPCTLSEREVTPEHCARCPFGVEVIEARDGVTYVRCRHPEETTLDDEPPPAPVMPRVGAPSRGRSRADLTRVSVLMLVDVVCAHPDLQVRALEHVFATRRIGGVPVVDDRGLAIGMVSSSDVVCARRHPSATLVSEIMMPIVFTLQEHASIAQAAALMVAEHVQQIPIVSPERMVVGIVSSLEICRWVAMEDGYLSAALGPSH
jgi:CBS domain-containing protein